MSPLRILGAGALLLTLLYNFISAPPASTRASVSLRQIAREALDQTTHPLFTGGLFTYSGSASGSFSGSNSGESVAVQNNMDPWSTEYLVSLGYPNVPTPVYTSLPHGDEFEPQALTYPNPVGMEHVQVTIPDQGTYNCNFTYPGEHPYFIAGPRLTPGATISGVYGTRNTTPITQDCAYGSPTESVGMMSRMETAIDFNFPWKIPKKMPEKTILHKAFQYSGPVKACTDYPTCSEQANITGSYLFTCALCVSDIVFKQLKNPAGKSNEMSEISDDTYDGNQVEIDATVDNTSPVAISTPLTFVDQVANTVLPESDPGTLEQPVDFPANTTTKVKFTWNTSGFAWDKGQPQTHREIAVMTPFGSAYRNLNVLPKPVVLVHGWNSGPATWDSMKSSLQQINSDWKGYAVGDNPEWGSPMNTDPISGNSIETNAAIEAIYIEKLRKSLAAQHVDIVAHSMGGLISRDYIDHLMTLAAKPPDDKPVVSHLLMLGTPNEGSSCAVPLSGLAGLFDNAVPTFQLRPDFVENVFDKQVTHQNGVPFSVIAGIGYYTCLEGDDGDTVVSEDSAWWHYSDVASTHKLHTELPNDEEVLSKFIKPHLALDPSQVSAEMRSGRQRSIHRGTSALPSLTGAELIAAKKARITAGASLTIPFAVSDETEVGGIAITPASVKLSLISNTGASVGVSNANSPEAAPGFRILGATKPKPGSWKFVATNQSKSPVTVELGALAVGSKTSLQVTTDRLNSHQVQITAALSTKGTKLKGANIFAMIPQTNGKPSKVILLDDGKHGDGKAGDGLYGIVPKISTAPASFFNLDATKGGVTRIASTCFAASGC